MLGFQTYVHEHVRKRRYLHGIQLQNGRCLHSIYEFRKSMSHEQKSFFFDGKLSVDRSQNLFGVDFYSLT